MPDVRPLSTIDCDIAQHWSKISYTAALPYLEILLRLNSIRDVYDYDRTPATTIVRGFLLNSSGWRGDDARRIKQELRGMLPE